jgi:hypothetical protein
VRRFTPQNGNQYCDYAGRPRPEGADEYSLISQPGPHSLELLYIGRFLPRGSRSCVVRLSVRTKNVLGEEFSSFPEKLLEFQPSQSTAYPVADTWELLEHLGLKLDTNHAAVGVCDGKSHGVGNPVSVGVVRVGNDIALRIHSGPIGTECTWKIYMPTMRDNWNIAMHFEKQQTKDACDSVGQKSVGHFEFTRTSGWYFRGNGTLELRYANQYGSIPRVAPESFANHMRYIRLKCDPTLVNDHAVILRMVSADLVADSPRGNCTWKCAFPQ